MLAYTNECEERVYTKEQSASDECLIVMLRYSASRLDIFWETRWSTS